MGKNFPRFRLNVPTVLLGAMGILLLALSWGCSGSELSIIKVDGSSTVFPITEAMAEEFQNQQSNVQVTVGISGTGGGFKRFCRGETDISDASRPIKPVEVEACNREGIDYIELPVAFDGLSVMVNPENDWVDFLTVEELTEIWKPGSTVVKWSDVRPEWPGEDIFLAGADTDSGTFDYFTKAIVGEEGASRSDYTASADDNVLVQAIAGDKHALGYFGFAYYVESVEKLKLVPVDPGTGPVAPSIESINGNEYVPLSRPLFIYVNSQAVQERSEVRDFVRFFFQRENTGLVRDVGYVELPDKIYELARQRLDSGTTGSIFGGKGSQVGVSLEDLLGER